MSCAFASAPSFAVGAPGACSWPYTLLSYLDFLNTNTYHYATNGAVISLPGGLLAASCTLRYVTTGAATYPFATAASCNFDSNNAMAVNASGCGVLYASSVQFDYNLNAFAPFAPAAIPVRGTQLAGGAAACTTCPAGTNCSFDGTTQPDPCPKVSA